MNSAADWAGDERRGIPIHILNFIRETVSDETEEIKKALNEYRQQSEQRHAEEMERYQTIIDNQTKNADVAEQRHVALIRSFDSYSTKTEVVHNNLQSAFLIDRHGNPDFVGHANAHESWIRQVEQNRKLLQDIRTAVIAALALAVGGWFLKLVWAGALIGPQ